MMKGPGVWWLILIIDGSNSQEEILDNIAGDDSFMAGSNEGINNHRGDWLTLMVILTNHEEA